MTSLSAFVDAPSVSFLDNCQKAQLVEIAEHYDIAVVGSKRKHDIKTVIVSSLFEQGVLQKSESGAAGFVPVVVQTAGLTFEQQKELLAMQFDQQKLQLEMRLEQEYSTLVQKRSDQVETQICRCRCTIGPNHGLNFLRWHLAQFESYPERIMHNKVNY